MIDRPDGEAIVTVLRGKWMKDHGSCHCPAHDDGTASLSVSTVNGTTLVHCHAGCSQQAVLDALKARGLWPDGVGGQRSDHQPQRAKARKAKAAKESIKPEGKLAVVATRIFPYEDEAGAVLFETVRKELADGTKRIFQRRVDALGRTVHNLKGVRLIPYRLPQLIAAIDAGQTVFIVEGEAKVSLLGSWHLPATCNPMGAGKWRPEYAEPFKRRRVPVVILPDNDEAGEKHACQVAGNLAPWAESIKIVQLPRLGPKEDVINWAFRGGTKDLLLAFVEEMTPWEPPADPAQQAEPAAETREPEPPDPEAEAESLPEEADDADQDKAPMFSEEDLALRFAGKHSGELRFVAAWARWFFWRGGRWEADDTLRAFHHSRRICRDAAEQCSKAKLKAILASARTEAAVERIARSDRRLAATVDQWDSDDLLLKMEVKRGNR